MSITFENTINKVFFLKQVMPVIVVYNVGSCHIYMESQVGFHMYVKVSKYQHISFIHSDHFYSASSSPFLLRSAPDTARILCRSFMPKRRRQLWVKDLPKVPTWRLERESNPQPSVVAHLLLHSYKPHSPTYYTVTNHILGYIHPYAHSLVHSKTWIIRA